MGIKFGDLARVRHVITFSLSPFEQRAFPNFFSEVLPNTWRRVKGGIIRLAPIGAAFYLIYTWTMHKHEQSLRKNPADYANDE